MTLPDAPTITDPIDHVTRTAGVAGVLAEPLARELLASPIAGHLAYIGLDGDPRNVPVGFWFKDDVVVFATPPDSEKVPAIEANPRVAFTVDTWAHWASPNALMLRGTATITIVEGVSRDYLDAFGRRVPEHELTGWEAATQAVTKQQAIVTIVPDRATLLDFKTRFPKAVANMLQAADSRAAVGQVAEPNDPGDEQDGDQDDDLDGDLVPTVVSSTGATALLPRAPRVCDGPMVFGAAGAVPLFPGVVTGDD